MLQMPGRQAPQSVTAPRLNPEYRYELHPYAARVYCLGADLWCAEITGPHNFKTQWMWYDRYATRQWAEVQLGVLAQHKDSFTKFQARFNTSIQ